MDEIAVIGGSAAGFLTAQRLASAGASVDVYERSSSIAPSPRTLIVTPHLLDIAGPAGRSCVVNRINRFELFADGKVADIDLENPDLIIERSALIRSLAEAASEEGARVHLDSRFKRLEMTKDAIRLDFAGRRDSETFSTQATTVVGADGTTSRVARAAGLPRQRTVALLQALVEWPKGLPSDTTRVWFRPQDTSYFYWLIPESPTKGMLGLIAEDAASIRAKLDAFLTHHDLVPLEYQAAVAPAYERWIPIHRRHNGSDVYLVGDAAGHVKVSTVGGIVTGLRGAAAVTEMILGRGNGQLKALRRELNTHLMIRKALHVFDEDDYSYLIENIARPVDSLRKVSRDRGTRALLSFAGARPGVILHAIRAFLLQRG